MLPREPMNDRGEPGADLAPGTRRRSTGDLPRVEIVRWSLLGLLALLAFVAVDVANTGGRNPVSFLQPGRLGPATEAVAEDFPEVQQLSGSGLDGQMYYAIARNPFHLDEVAEHLDQPRYRLQRPLLPWTAWLLQPFGGGIGLVWALVLVGTVGIGLGAVATGALSTHWGGPAWAAALFPLLPGAYWSLRVSVSDALALALALAAMALASRNRYGLAIAAGVLAVLAKEPAVLLLLGWALHRRTRRDVVMLAAAGLTVVTWMAWLRFQLPADPPRPSDLGLPFVGLVDAWSTLWSDGRELVGMATSVGGLVLGAAALWRRGLEHPLGWVIVVQIGFLLCMGLNPIGMNFGGTRMAMPLLISSLLALLAPATNQVRPDVEPTASRITAPDAAPGGDP